MDGRGGTFQTLVMARACYYHWIQIIRTTNGRRVVTLHLMDLCLTWHTDQHQDGNKEMLSHDSTSSQNLI